MTCERQEWWLKVWKESSGHIRRTGRILGKENGVENFGQDGKRQERGWLNLGVRGHWSVWQPEIQIRNLEQGRRERRARRWGPNRFCIFPLFMKIDRLHSSIPWTQQVFGKRLQVGFWGNWHSITNTDWHSDGRKQWVNEHDPSFGEHVSSNCESQC